MSDCLFCKFVRKEIPTRVVFENDCSPSRLKISIQSSRPRSCDSQEAHRLDINEMTPNDETLLGHLAFVARQIAHDKKIQDSGYRTVINTGPDAGRCLPRPPASARGARNDLAAGIVSPPVSTSSLYRIRHGVCNPSSLKWTLPSGFGSVSPIPSLLAGLDR